MTRLIGWSILIFYALVGVCVSVYFGIEHGVMGYVVGATLGFGGCYIVGSALIRLCEGIVRARRNGK